MNLKNRYIIIITVLIITVAAICFCNSTVKAESSVSERLEQLREKYPHNYYWNHPITSENVGKTVNGTWDETWCDIVTTHPCNHSFDTIGQYGCNAFDHGIACWGFANKVFYEVFGIRASSTERLYDVDHISVGDHVRFNYNHSAIVLSRNGNKIKLLECNYNDTDCKIQWDRTDSISNVLWYQHADNWDQVTDSGNESSANANGDALPTGWYKNHDKWYYVKSDGSFFTGWLKYDNTWYYLLSDGTMATGWVQDGNARYYMKSNGAMATGWVKDQGKWYYFKANGSLCTGWIKENGVWYYLQSNGEMAVGWIQDGGTRYYLRSSGEMATGWVKDQGNWYYFSSSGAMKTGWLLDKGKWYLLQSDGAMATDWYNEGRTWYYLNSSGAMLTGWQYINNTWYYFKDSGAMMTGWFQDKTKTWYWFDKDGAMATGRKMINGKWEIFAGSGAWQYTE